MRKLLMAGAAVAVGLLAANAASAATILSSTFETPDVAHGSYGIFAVADGWTTLSGAGIEIQDHAAGDPAASGGEQFVELDSNNNSAMYYAFAQAGTYSFDFLFSPRPNVGAASNYIHVYLDDGNPGHSSLITGIGGGTTSWAQYTSITFFAAAGTKLIFAAEGTDDSLGGYLDNINIYGAGVPEPATWALMIGGFGLAGSALRRRRAIAA